MPLQSHEFFHSVTTLRPEMLGGDQDDQLIILRHTMMNPHLIDRENGISYVDRYFEFLARRVRVLLADVSSA